MKLLKQFVIAALFVPGFVALSTTTATAAPMRAAQPPFDYKTWENIVPAHEDETFGTIPFRRGFYDGDLTNRYNSDIVGEGFGTDKLRHKHGVTDLAMVKWVMSADGEPTLGSDEEGNDPNTTAHWEADLVNLECAQTELGEVCFMLPNDYTVVVAAETEIMDDYYDWPASMTGPSYDNLTPEDESVGIVTAYCKDHNLKCPAEVNQWYDREIWVPTA